MSRHNEKKLGNIKLMIVTRKYREAPYLLLSVLGQNVPGQQGRHLGEGICPPDFLKVNFFRKMFEIYAKMSEFGGILPPLAPP